MATGNMHNLTTLIKRLEAATSRLEDIATSVNSLDTPTGESVALVNGVPAPSSHAHSSPVPAQSPSTPTPRATPSAAAPVATSVQDDVPSEIEQYDKLIKDDVAKFVELSAKLDPLLGEQSREVRGVFEAQRKFLLITTKTKKPDGISPEFMELLKDTQTKMMSVDDTRQKNRGSPLRDHLAMVADGIAVLGWVTVDHKPAEMAAELFGGAQMYGNKILKQHKDKDAAQVEWVTTFYALIRAVVAYVKTSYPKGIPWNPQGISVAEAIKEASRGPAEIPTPTRAGGPPPPPPPPPPSSLTVGIPGSAPVAKGSDMGSVFQQLNQGSSVTSGLKKVDASQMTHKNPSLRTAAPVPQRSNSSASSSKSVPPGTKPKPESMRTKKPPRKELDGNKWIVENFESPAEPLEIKVEMNQTILITKCKNTTIRVIGKGNAISIDSSVKTSIVIDSLVSSVDVIKCPSFALQVLETLPTVLLDQVDGATIYLGKDSLGTEVFTSKCSAVNIYLPPVSQAEDDYSENNVPEQLRSYIKNGKLVTEIVEHKG